MYHSLSSKSQERNSIITFLFLATFFVTIALTSKLSNVIDFIIEKNFFSCFFQAGLIKTWNKKYFSSLIIHEKIFYNISGAIHSNNISEILILFEYFRNMYPWQGRLITATILFLPLVLYSSSFLGVIKNEIPELSWSCAS